MFSALKQFFICGTGMPQRESLNLLFTTDTYNCEVPQKGHVLRNNNVLTENVTFVLSS